MVVRVSEAVRRIKTYGLATIVMMVGQRAEHYGHCAERKDRTKNPVMHISCHIDCKDTNFSNIYPQILVAFGISIPKR